MKNPSSIGTILTTDETSLNYSAATAAVQGHWKGHGMVVKSWTVSFYDMWRLKDKTRWGFFADGIGGMYLSALNLSGGNHPWNVSESQLKVSASVGRVGLLWGCE